jgi:hypothetical protein
MQICIVFNMDVAGVKTLTGVKICDKNFMKNINLILIEKINFLLTLECT